MIALSLLRLGYTLTRSSGDDYIVLHTRKVPPFVNHQPNMTYEYDRCPPRAIEQLILDGLEFQRPSIEALRSLISTKISSEPASTATCPIPHSKGIALGYPWKWLRDEYGRIIGEYSLHPDPPDDLTLEDMMRLPPERQEWDLGYGLEPDYHRKGITTDVLRVMLDDWVRHWMHIGKVNAVSEIIMTGRLTRDRDMRGIMLLRDGS